MEHARTIFCVKLSINHIVRLVPQKPYYTNVSDVPRSLQSWVWTIHTVVLTADVFQLFTKTKWNRQPGQNQGRTGKSQGRRSEATESIFESIFCLQAKKPLHSGSYEHRVPKIKQTFFCTRFWFNIVIGHLGRPYSTRTAPMPVWTGSVTY